MSITPPRPVTVAGAGNTVASTGGVALNVTGTTIGAGGLTFRSIFADGGTNGIVLNNTGASGGLTVSVNGGTCSTAATCTGGAIQNTTVAIALTSTTSPSFDRMFIQNTTSAGIYGTEVNGFTFTNGRIDNSGTAGAGIQRESNIAFND